MNDNVLMEMLIEQNGRLKSIENTISTQQNTSPQIDVLKVEQLSNQMETSVTKMDEVIEQARKPVVKENRFILDIVSSSTFFIIIGFIAISVVLSVALYMAKQPNYDRRDNDLKYRYIKMKGEASPKLIAELENLFELNRDNIKINQIREDVEQYEETVRKQIIAQEQARLKKLEAEKFNIEVNELKNK